MLDVGADARRSARKAETGPPLDFQSHLAALKARGLLLRVDRPINKDTELHPLVRWQFQGGLKEDQRRAFLFTNVIDSSGHRYDIPVAVGALAASPQIYAVGMGRPVEEIEASWMRAIASPIPPVLIDTPACQAVVITGEELRGSGQGLAGLPGPISTCQPTLKSWSKGWSIPIYWSRKVRSAKVTAISRSRISTCPCA